MAFKDTVKEWFKTGLKPTQAQFYSKFDFLRWKDEKIPIGDIEEIENILNAKVEAEVLTDHLTTATAHASLFEAKEDKTQKGAPGGYAPLNISGKVPDANLPLKVVSLTTPTGVPSDGDEWILYTL